MIKRFLLLCGSASLIAASTVDGHADDMLPFLREYLVSDDYLTIVKSHVVSNKVLMQDLSLYMNVPSDIASLLPTNAVENTAVTWRNPVLSSDEPWSPPSLSMVYDEHQRFSIPGSSHVIKSLEKVDRITDALYMPSEDWAMNFDAINVGLYELVQELSYMTSTETPNADVTKYVQLLTQLHYRTALFFAGPNPAGEFLSFSSFLHFSLSYIRGAVDDESRMAAAYAAANAGPVVAQAREAGMGWAAAAGQLQPSEEMMEDMYAVGKHLIGRVFGKATEAPTEAPTTAAPTVDPAIEAQRKAVLASFVATVTKDLDALVVKVDSLEARAGGDATAFSLAVADLKSSVLSQYCGILVAAKGAKIVTAQQLAPAKTCLESLSKRLGGSFDLSAWAPVRDEVRAAIDTLKQDITNVLQ